MENLIPKAKTNLILDQPFFASLLMGIPMILDETVKTMETDGNEIRFNPQWTGALTLSELTFVLAHETMHCVFQHMHRRGDRNPNKWNIAADYIINELLINEKIGTMPKGGLYDAALVKRGNGTTEGVYGLLPQETEQKEPGDEGGSLDCVKDAGQDAAEISEKQSEMKVKIAQARNAAAMSGKLSQGIDRLVTELVKTRTDWRSVLRRFLSERAKTDLSYSKPKRRFLSDDICLPSLIGEKMGSVVVAIDESGSVDDRLLALFETEVKAIFQDVGPQSVKIIYFDSQVLEPVQVFGPDDEIVLKHVGGGGTKFSPIFERINADVDSGETAPVACVVLTDLYCSDFGPTPEYPVLWACTTDLERVPFGEVVSLKGE